MKCYAKVDSDNRIVEWTREHLDGFDVEFSNGDYVDEMCHGGLSDFVIENGEAIYSPSPDNEIAYLKDKLASTDYITSKTMDAVMQCSTMSMLLKTVMSLNEQYGDVIEQRKVWRDRINELQD